jgi:hypothetical protein
MLRYFVFSSLLFLLTGLYAQESTLASATSTSLAEGKNSGKFAFVLPEKLDKSQVEKNASYYTSFFTVSFDEKAHTANITMISNDEKGRLVITRFLTVCGAQKVKVDNTEYDVYPFYEKYLK